MTGTSGSPVLVDELTVEGAPVIRLTLNRPDAMNALGESVILGLDQALTAAERRSDVSALLITGAGRAFSAGGDLKAYETLYADRQAYVALLQLMATVFDRLERSSLVSVAMINGVCVAGGLELALCCDLVTIADDAVVGDGHLRYWQLPGAGGAARLIRHVGVAMARRMLLTGESLHAEDAVARGLAVLRAPAEELLAATCALIADAAGRPRDVNAAMKALMAESEYGAPESVRERERRLVADYVTGMPNSRAVQGLARFRARRSRPS